MSLGSHSLACRLRRFRRQQYRGCVRCKRRRRLQLQTHSARCLQALQATKIKKFEISTTISIQSVFASRYSPQKPRATRDVDAGQPCARHVSSTQILVDRFRSSFAAVFHCGLCSACFAATATNAHHNVETWTILYTSVLKKNEPSSRRHRCSTCVVANRCVALSRFQDGKSEKEW